MKNKLNVLESFLLAMILLIGISAKADTTPQIDYSEGQTIYVHALNGLHLRNFPDKNGEIITTMGYGDALRVSEDQHFDSEKTIRSGWYIGRWIKVSFVGLEGYVFDAFISALPVPDVGYELGDCNDPVSAINAYIQNELDVVAGADTLLYRVSDAHIKTKILYVLDEDHRVIYSDFDNGYSTALYLQNTRVMDAFNLLRGLFVGCEELERLMDEAIFIKDKGTDQISEIKAEGLLIKQSGMEVQVKCTYRYQSTCHFIDLEN